MASNTSEDRLHVGFDDAARPWSVGVATLRRRSNRTMSSAIDVVAVRGRRLPVGRCTGRARIGDGVRESAVPVASVAAASVSNIARASAHWSREKKWSSTIRRSWSRTRHDDEVASRTRSRSGVDARTGIVDQGDVARRSRASRGRRRSPVTCSSAASMYCRVTLRAELAEADQRVVVAGVVRARGVPPTSSRSRRFIAAYPPASTRSRRRARHPRRRRTGGRARRARRRVRPRRTPRGGRPRRCPIR